MKRMPAIFLLLLMVVGGCGYQVPGQKTAWVGLDHRLLYVEFFTNLTAEPYLDHLLTEAVIRQFARSRQFELTEDRQAADLVLNGSALRFESQPSAYDRRDQIAEYKAVLEIRARLMENGDGSVLWQEDLSRKENYPAADDKNRQLEFRSQVAGLAAVRLAEDLQARLVDAF